MRKQLITGVIAGVLLVSACGEDSDDAVADSTPAPAEPTTPDTTGPSDTTGDTGDGDGAVKIVSISPALTEIVFAIGAGDQVVAVDAFSTYPPEVFDLPNDLSGYEPNIEAIASYEPDLVVTSTDEVVAPLEALGIEVYVGPSAPTLDDSYAQIEQLGALTGHVGDAAKVVADMQADIDAIVAAAPQLDEPLTVYHELTTDYFSADSTTFIGQAYTLLGLENIADRSVGDNGGYPQLNAETVIDANPDLIFLADTKFELQNLETVSARPGWDALAAVQQGHVFEMDDDIASRWGPRFVDYLQEVADAVEQATSVSAGG